MKRDLANISLAGACVAGRLLGTLAMYALLARALGPETFGEFAYWYTVGIILSAVSDYGFGNQLLSSLPVLDRSSARDELIRLAQGKAFLVLLVFVVGAGFALLTTNAVGPTATINHAWVYIVLLSGAASTQTDFFGWALKAKARFRLDTTHTMVGTALGNVMGGLVGYLTSSLALAATTMLVFRLTGLAFQFRAVSGLFDIYLSDFCRADWRSLIKILTGGRSFALDGIAVQMATNFDVLIARNFLDSHASGVYLAGSRLVQAALAGVPVLASVFIPQIAGHPEDRRAHLPKLFLATVLVIVVLIVSIFYSARNYLPLLIFGADFRELSLLLVPMGLSVAIRYVGSLPGTALIAMKEQRKRIKSLSLTVLLGAIAVTVLVLDLTSFTITSWSLSLIYLMMGVVQTVLFYISYAKIANRTKSNEQAR